MRKRSAALGLCLLILVISGSITAGQAQPYCGANDAPVQARGSLRTDPVRVTINGVRYAVPRNYFDFPPPRECDSVQEAFSVRAFLPDFSGPTRETLREFRHVGGGWGRVVTILVRSTIQIRSNGSADLGSFIDHIWGHRWGVTWNDTSIYGLESGFYRDSTWKWDVFRAGANREATLAMRCTSPESVPYPGCEGILFFKGAQVEFGFDRKRLAEWKSIRDGVVTLLDEFVRNGQT